jgi:biopolymer transport protein ExbD
MTDIVFLLPDIFMLTSTMVTNTWNLVLPKARGKQTTKNIMVH